MKNPECMNWPTSGYAVLKAWQDGRCGMCGCGGNLVMDHDHMTGLIRGWLCNGCNIAEPHSDGDGWNAWRAGSNPAGILGIKEEYRYRNRGQKLYEIESRTPTSDAELDAMTEAMSTHDPAVELLIQEQIRLSDIQRAQDKVDKAERVAYMRANAMI